MIVEGVSLMSRLIGTEDVSTVVELTETLLSQADSLDMLSNEATEESSTESDSMQQKMMTIMLESLKQDIFLNDDEESKEW